MTVKSIPVYLKANIPKVHDYSSPILFFDLQ